MRRATEVSAQGQVRKRVRFGESGLKLVTMQIFSDRLAMQIGGQGANSRDAVMV
jgi:hypothetical protein